MSDPRSLFANPSVAHISLTGQVDALRYTEGHRMQVAPPVANIRAAPDAQGIERQALKGAMVTMLETDLATAFIREETMGYVGYLPAGALRPWQAPTHRVAARTSLIFDQPDFKTPSPEPVSLGTCLSVAGEDGKYARLADGRFAISAHLLPVETPETDPVSVAERLIGAPYLWGGNASFGIDCSGLVQIALAACGVPCPGDSDQQRAALGETLPHGATPQRGDLMFWKGHVAWVADRETLLHANAHHMAVAYEPIADAIARIGAQSEGPPLRHARLALG